MRLFEGKRAQGATEYLLMLAAVLVIVAVAIYYIRGAAPKAVMTGEAELKAGDNTTVIFTPTSMTPKKIAAGEWSWAVYHDATLLGSDTGAETLEEGIPVELSLTSAAQSGDEVKVKYKDTWYSVATVV